ncbi:MAG: precorrin-6A/cobalt-precorrin-6A reductase, partial [Thermocrispum sp.]
LRLQRPGWQPAAGVAWHWAEDLAHAAALVPELGSRAFLTTGRQGLAAFAGLPDVWFLVRCVDPPEPSKGERLPQRHELLLARGPYTVDAELDLMRRYAVDVLVTKDSGGSMTEAKLHAAGHLAIPVIVVRRPARPLAQTVTSVDDAAAWVRLVLEDAGEP